MKVYYVVALHDKTIFENNIEQYLIDKNTILIENIENDSMFKKYNRAIDQIPDLSDEDVLCFVHEDIKLLDDMFHSKVEMVFKLKPEVGILGIYGTTQFVEGGGWWMCDRPTYARGHIMQGRPDLEKPFHMTEGNIGFYDDLVSVDGCMFCMSGKMAKKYRFDELNFDGYHFYDVDTCFRALEMGFKVAVADILIEHASEGPLPESWVKNRETFLEKWKIKGYSFPMTAASFINKRK